MSPVADGCVVTAVTGKDRPFRQISKPELPVYHLHVLAIMVHVGQTICSLSFTPRLLFHATRLYVLCILILLLVDLQ